MSGHIYDLMSTHVRTSVFAQVDVRTYVLMCSPMFHVCFCKPILFVFLEFMHVSAHITIFLPCVVYVYQILHASTPTQRHIVKRSSLVTILKQYPNMYASTCGYARPGM